MQNQQAFRAMENHHLRHDGFSKGIIHQRTNELFGRISTEFTENIIAHLTKTHAHRCIKM